MSAIFGAPSKSDQGSQQSSSSSNQAYPMLSQALGGQVNNGTTASNGLSAMLGLGGDTDAQNKAFSNWQNSTGYQFGLNQGTQAITQNAAAKGLLNSGSTAKALDTYGQQYANTQYGNYTGQLQNLVNSGNQAAGVIGSTGQQSQSQGTSNSSSTGEKKGAGGFLGALL